MVNSCKLYRTQAQAPEKAKSVLLDDIPEMLIKGDWESIKAWNLSVAREKIEGLSFFFLCESSLQSFQV